MVRKEFLGLRELTVGWVEGSDVGGTFRQNSVCVFFKDRNQVVASGRNGAFSPAGAAADREGGGRWLGGGRAAGQAKAGARRSRQWLSHTTPGKRDLGAGPGELTVH